MIRVGIGLGGNLSDRRASLTAALAELRRLGTDLRVGSLYETEAVGPPQPDYLNSAVCLRTGLEPEALLEELLRIERRAGRVRTTRWGPRTLDLDLLAGLDEAGRQLVVDTPTLTLPHPELSRRAFALAPLLEVLPELRSAYGPVLAALGGPPPRVGRPLAGGKGWTAAAHRK